MLKFEIVWQAPEFEYREKDVSWHWISVIVAVFLLSAAVWQKNFLFGFFIVVAEILILVWANQKPRTIEFKLDEKGFAIGKNTFYPYREIAAFSLNEEVGNEWTDLAFRFQRSFRPPLKIQIPKQRFSEIEKALAPVVPRIDFEESFLETLERLLGF